jgi:hypothetical protein
LGWLKQLVNDWTHGEDWQTWVAHSVIALIITLIASLIAWWGGASEPVVVGAAVAIGYYLIRELEQTLYSWVGGKPIDWKDNLMDVVAPAATVLVVAGIAAAI